MAKRNSKCGTYASSPSTSRTLLMAMLLVLIIAGVQPNPGPATVEFGFIKGPFNRQQGPVVSASDSIASTLHVRHEDMDRQR